MDAQELVTKLCIPLRSECLDIYHIGVLLSFALESSAQKSVNQDSKSSSSGSFCMYGFKTGLNISSMVIKDDDANIKWGSDEDEHDLKRFDFGLTGGAGVQIKLILIGFNYNLGMMNISPDTENGLPIANRIFGRCNLWRRWRRRKQ